MAEPGPGRRRPRRNPAMVGENPWPPRYRLLVAAAALPQRAPDDPSESFGRDCPACGRDVVFTEIHRATGIEYVVEEHDCVEDRPA